MRVSTFITAFAVGVAAAPVGPDLSAASGPLNMVLKEAQKQVPPTVNKLNSAVAPSQKEQAKEAEKAKASPSPSPSPSPAAKKPAPSPSSSSTPAGKPKPTLPPKPKSDPLSAVTGILGGLGAREVEPAKMQSINDIEDAQTLSDITGKLNRRVNDLDGAVDEVPVEKIAGLTDKLSKDKLGKRASGFDNPFEESLEGAAVDAMAEDGEVKKTDVEGLERRATSAGGGGIEGIVTGITNGLGTKKVRSPGGSPLSAVTGLLGGAVKRDNEPRSGGSPLDLVTGLLGRDNEPRSGGSPLDLVTGLLGRRDNEPRSGGSPLSAVTGLLGGAVKRDNEPRSGGSPLDLVTGLLGGAIKRDNEPRAAGGSGSPLSAVTGLLGGAIKRDNEARDSSNASPGLDGVTGALGGLGVKKARAFQV